MVRQILITSAAVACIVALTGCSKKNSTEPTEPPASETPTAPAGSTLLLAEGFGGNLSHWEGVYMVSSMEMYRQMRITTDAAHTGTHSLTTDSNMTALYHTDTNRVESGTAGVQFYMMAQSLGEINFGLEIGQNPGSSGAVTPAFGIFFDPSDSIKCTIFNTWPAVNTQTMIAPIQAGHWYKCKIEVNMTDSTASYYLDDTLKHTELIATSIGLMGIDRVLVFRGMYGNNFSSSSEGTKPYYIDDIVWYKK
jgi:hypothetical protein